MTELSSYEINSPLVGDEDRLRKILQQKLDAEKKVKERGGDKFEQLEARLADVKTGRVIEDIVVYAIRKINNKEEARDFYEGYVKNISNHPEKYHPTAKKMPHIYARADIYTILDNFVDDEKQMLWKTAINN